MTYKADDIASVILSRSESWLDAWSLQKLLYYVQAWHAAITDEPLFGEPIKAWADGPVVPAVRHARRERHTRRPQAQDTTGIALDHISSGVIDLVLGAYGSMSGDQLRALTHVESPWLEARGDLPEDAKSSAVIPVESMAAFYRSNRKLGGRSAADLAAAGIHVTQGHWQGPVDVDELLASLPPESYSDYDDDPWGGANLMQDNGSQLPSN